MRVLVTGATGYIGSFIVERLLKESIEVSALVREEKEYPHLSHSRVTVYRSSVTQPISIALKDPVDLVIHLAAANDVDSLDPAVAIGITSLGTKNVLDFCRKENIKKLIYFSTFQVYGAVDGNMNEATECLPNNDYGLTHLFAEQYIQMYERLGIIDAIILRPTNIYGAPLHKEIDRWSLVPSCFCKSAKEFGEIRLKTSGLQNRDFLDVNDLAEFTVKLCSVFEGHKNSVINVCSGNQFTILQMAEKVASIYQEMYGKACPIVVESNYPSATNRFAIDRSGIDSLGYRFGSKESLVLEIRKLFSLLAD